MARRATARDGGRKIKWAPIPGRTFQGFVLLLCLLPLLARATDVQATLDRNTMQLGETVTLNLHIADGSGNLAMPDLSPLQQDFDILGRSQSSNLSIINGKSSSELVIGVVLRPKHAGTITIPSLAVAGARTTPLQLQVDPPNPAAAAAMHRSVFMEAEVTPQRAWVGQQLSYVVRLYYSGNITSGALDTPQIDGVQLSQVGGDLRYDAVQGGRQYHVIERRYALVPQHAGTLAIPALGFQGEALDPSDPDSFFGAGTPVSASAPALTVQVQAAPADWGKAAWLPARALSLTLTGWPDANATVRVGQPINLTMKLSTTGLPFETLPQLSLPALQGATVYPDQPATATTNDGPWLVGSRQRGFAVVPEQAGTLALPATTLRWFDVTSGQERTAEIPAHSVTVLPAAGAANAPPVTTAPSAASPAPAEAASAPAVAAAPASAQLKGAPWRWIALASLLLWLLSVLAWWLWRQRPARSAVAVAAASATGDGTRRLRQAFLAAARGSDAAAQLRSLLAWAQAERPAIRHPGALVAALADEAQRRALAELQRRCYHDAAAPMGGDDLAEVFKRGFAWREADKADDDTLPPLYPFKVK